MYHRSFKAFWSKKSCDYGGIYQEKSILWRLPVFDIFNVGPVSVSVGNNANSIFNNAPHLLQRFVCVLQQVVFAHQESEACLCAVPLVAPLEVKKPKGTRSTSCRHHSSHACKLQITLHFNSYPLFVNFTFAVKNRRCVMCGSAALLREVPARLLQNLKLTRTVA